MQVISTRLAKLFRILIEQDKPVSVDELSHMLGVSRRTIFRELEKTDTLLGRYGITMATSLKEGIYLNGEPEKLMLFAQDITDNSDKQVVSKGERQRALAFALLDSKDYHKLYYYASMLEVSEATLSLDLDTLEKEFADFDVKLDRKKGLGVAVVGQEKNIRKLLVSYMARSLKPDELCALKYNFPKSGIEDEIKSIIEAMSAQLDWITFDTLRLMEYRLCVQVSRVMKQCIVCDNDDVAQTGVMWQIAKKIAGEIECRFAIDLPNSELRQIAKGLISTRAKEKSRLSAEEERLAFNKVHDIALELIDRFDSRLAPMLKVNEDFVRGLSIHMFSAIERIKNGYEIADPLKGQIEYEFPDIYNRVKAATHLISAEYAKSVPEGEVACIAAHFGAAVMQLGQSKLRRRLRVGIICMGGIGVSYMLNSQVKKRFDNELITEICEYKNYEQWSGNDFIISTIPIDAPDMVIINVNPILTEKEYKQIRTTIDSIKAHPHVSDAKKHYDLRTMLGKLNRYTGELGALLNNYCKITARDAKNIDDLAKVSGEYFGADERSATLIYEALMRRETMSSQLIEDLGLLLLHCQTDGVSQPVVAILSTMGRKVQNDNAHSANTCMVMLIPTDSSKELKEVIGSISSALIEDESFLRAVTTEDSEAVYAKIEAIVGSHLSHFARNILSEEDEV